MGLLLLLMIGLPLVGAALNGLILRTRHTRRAGVVATAFAGSSFALAVILFMTLLGTHTPVTLTLPWFKAGETLVNWGFQFDSLTAVMALVVTGIGTAIHLYSIGYMSEEPTPSRYFAYLNLFLFSMLTLISGDNLVVMFVGWEGVGLCSYLLIGYWYQDLEKANAGIKAFVVNRIGDAGFLLGIFLLLQLFGTVSFAGIIEALGKPDGLDLNLINLAALFLFVGAMGKSAQIPLYVWLPDAMAGPTPVSALIHAATMVTAGIYLIVRLNPLFILATDTSLFIAYIGAATALMAATIAIVQRDIKKVLAYSTVSQLGLMFLALGTQNYFAALFHVITHAFFKALLFLGAGSVIHACHGEQDIFEMGGLKKDLPKTHLTFLIGTLAISGIPPLSGFFSKDMILYGALMSERSATILWFVGSLTSTITAFYMTRLYALTFLGSYRGHAHPHESPNVMLIPLYILTVGSVFAGLLATPHGLHLLPQFLEHFLGNTVPPFVEKHAMLSEMGAMGVATLLAILGVTTGFLMYKDGPRGKASGNPIHSLLFNKYWIDELYGLVIVKPFEIGSQFLARVIDVRVIDAAVLLPTKLCRAGATFLSLVQAGAAQFYLLVMLAGAVVILWITLRGMVL